MSDPPDNSHHTASGFPRIDVAAEVPKPPEPVQAQQVPDLVGSPHQVGALPGAAATVLAPGDDVPKLRAEARASIGGPATPMVELDGDGRIVFVGGDWSEFARFTKPAADPLDALLDGASDRDAVEAAIAQVASTRIAQRFEHKALSGAGHLRVVPIPSPRVVGQIHTLIGLEAGATSPASPAEARPLQVSAARYAVRADEPASKSRPRRPPQDSSTSDATPRPQVSTDLGAESAAASDPASAVALPAGNAESETLVLIGAEPEPSTTIKALTAFALVCGYVAFQGLYLGPIYGWPSPLSGLFKSSECLIQPLCENAILNYNHLGVIALLSCLVATTAAFALRRAPGLAPDRPVEPGDLPTMLVDQTAAAPNQAPPTPRSSTGPAALVAVAGLAITIVSAQALLTNSASYWPWLISIAAGAIAAWWADRDHLAGGLAATMTSLALAIGIAMTMLGFGGVWLGERRLLSVVVVAIGIALLAWSQLLHRSSSSSFDRLDHLAMVAGAGLALVLGLARHHTWRYAFIGDEWIFFEEAMERVRNNPKIETFEIGGPNDYFTGLTFELQAMVMRLAGADVWGWRLSALLPMVLSVPAMYAFTRWLVGRRAAIAAAIALASGHMLLSFSMIGYNNSQSLVAVSASFAALAWAHRRPSALRFFVLGAAVGSTFLIYAMARLALLPLGLLFLVLFRDPIATWWKRLGWSVLGGLAVAAPALFSVKNWQALLKATPVEAEATAAETGVMRQMIEHAISGWLSFIASTHDTHFIVGPHLDVIAAALLIVGLAFAIARAGHDRPLRWFLIGGVVLWTLVNAIQQYPQISNTRSFLLPLMYCVFVGIGVHVVLSWRRLAVGAVVGALALFGLVSVGLNQWHIGAHANQRQHLTEQALVVAQFQASARPDGYGMPVHVAWPEAQTARLTMVLRAHDVAAERIRAHPDGSGLDIDRLCAETEPTMVLIHRAHPEVETWKPALESCFGGEAQVVTDPSGVPKLVRLVNAAGAGDFDLAASERFGQGTETPIYDQRDIIDLAVDGSGVAYGLARDASRSRIVRLDGGGAFELAQSAAVDFDITADGLFVVAGEHGSDRIAFYDGSGALVARLNAVEDLPIVGGLAVDGDRLWVADTPRSRLVSMSLDRAAGVLESGEVRHGGGRLVEPTALARGVDGSVWVLDLRGGQLVLLDSQDSVVTSVAAAADHTGVPRLSAGADGGVVLPRPSEPNVWLVDRSGHVIDERGGAYQPLLAVSRSGEVLIADRRWHQVIPVGADPGWVPDPGAGTVAWGESVGSTSPVELVTPFDPAEADQVPVSTEVIETEPVDLGQGRSWREIGAVALGPVHAVDFDAAGVVVADTRGRIAHLDADGAVTAVAGFGTVSSHISDLVVGADGTTYALDAGTGELHIFAPGDGHETGPTSVPVDMVNSRGIGRGLGDTVLVAATGRAELVRFDRHGAIVGSVALPGRQPTDVAEASDSTLWIIDTEGSRLAHLAADGSELASVALDPFTSLESAHLSIGPGPGGEVVWVSQPESSTLVRAQAGDGSITTETVTVARPDGRPLVKAIGVAASPDGRVVVVDSQTRALFTLPG